MEKRRAAQNNVKVVDEMKRRRWAYNKRFWVNAGAGPVAAIVVVACAAIGFFTFKMVTDNNTITARLETRRSCFWFTPDGNLYQTEAEKERMRKQKAKEKRALVEAGWQ